MPLLRKYLLIFAIPTAICMGLVWWRFTWPLPIGWLLGANLSAFAIWAFDKSQSKKAGSRVPEMALHIMAAAGATPASFLAMGLLRHKNLKTSFQVLYAIFLGLQIALATLIWVF